MNHTIQDLIDQATNTCIAIDPAQAVPAPNMRFNKIFLELIVKECIRLNGKELSMAAHSRMLDIYLDHFGIEL